MKNKKQSQDSQKKTTGKSKEKPDSKAGGRPTKLTDQVIEDFTTAISIGSTYKLSAGYARISEESAALWLRLGRAEYAHRENGGTPNKKNEPYLRFLMATLEAETEAGIAWQKVLNTAAKADPNWALKMLRLRLGQGYIEYDSTTNIQIPNDMTPEFLDRIIAGENPVVVIKEFQDFRANQGRSLEAKDIITK